MPLTTINVLDRSKITNSVAGQCADHIHRFFEMLHAIEQAEKGHADPTPLPSRECMIAAQAKNKYSLVCTQDTRFGKPIIRSVVELWALEHSRLFDLMRGKITESDLTPSDFLPYSPKQAHLYVAITSPPFEPSALSKEFVRASIVAAFGVIREAYFATGESRHAIELYGLGASTEGKNLMRRAGFEEQPEMTRERHQRNPEDFDVWVCRLDHDRILDLMGKPKYTGRR